MKIKHSVSTRIANYLIVIIIFVGIIGALSLALMAGNKSYAEAINVSGSLRMQSYRILYEIEHEPQMVESSLRQYRVSLHSKSLVEINYQSFASQEVKDSYHNLIKRWEVMERLAREQNFTEYQKNIANYVEQVDQFVFTLQHSAEEKWIWALCVIIFSMLLIVIMVSYVNWYTRKAVVRPLEQLTRASTQVQMGQFKHIPLDVRKEDELGHLARTFTKMSSELGKLYSGLEATVNEKTQKLQQTNRSLTTLYHCSQLVTTNKIDGKILQLVLQNVMISEHLRYLELDVLDAPHWNICLGVKYDRLESQQTEMNIEGESLAVLRWQAGLPCPDLRTMQNVAQMLSRSLYFQRMQRQQEQLLLMEERSIIARELHDSLAQVLAFLQIQLTLLKHNLNKGETDSKQKSLSIIKQFEQALSDGYSQLRELLATFRLTVQEANLKLALEQVIDSLCNQTDIQMSVDCTLPSQSFNAQQLVNALQIVREAVLNAIKHSQGTLIEVIAHTNEDGEYELIVRDNGIGIPSLEEPDGHYGLNIMHERSIQLNAKLTIANRTDGGTEVKVTLAHTLS
ncbi:two-component system sensor histidine kinase NarQ [Aggregatibacter actinomycetemcomitans]|uniref:nitrate/nitrite two-component system sensor histidine kinase NarQ n=3 Tax=Aggregatibacter actinomycetemcomitans TaxID=714 RepID=UPI00022AD7E8|nr:nitrate/nitrite two-component system sensor histidine kinase NarQ [Aggregatibacter actinomycetemcomitans]KYK96295.1 ATPase [Aggregatibacter actinomycetemcomitans serotype d str. SA3733]ANU81589.1 two-component system sensor histidine kinase NarQ [Aggregatibacter actinomycetemcomitans]KOE65752.1 ATPase [Aggregatibacter actinomycetemcomitans serotype e str. A160]KOE67282.1 ATPase [Aggregatibacter actinomycetemcomitans serotype d str. I63B]KOE68694.1 ATPase [Aggregatibacter actinomycetemcomita